MGYPYEWMQNVDLLPVDEYYELLNERRFQMLFEQNKRKTKDPAFIAEWLKLLAERDRVVQLINDDVTYLDCEKKVLLVYETLRDLLVTCHKIKYANLHGSLITSLLATGKCLKMHVDENNLYQRVQRWSRNVEKRKASRKGLVVDGSLASSSSLTPSDVNLAKSIFQEEGTRTRRSSQSLQQPLSIASPPPNEERWISSIQSVPDFVSCATSLSGGDGETLTGGDFAVLSRLRGVDDPSNATSLNSVYSSCSSGSLTTTIDRPSASGQLTPTKAFDGDGDDDDDETSLLSSTTVKECASISTNVSSTGITTTGAFKDSGSSSTQVFAGRVGALFKKSKQHLLSGDDFDSSVD